MTTHATRPVARWLFFALAVMATVFALAQEPATPPRPKDSAEVAAPAPSALPARGPNGAEGCSLLHNGGPDNPDWPRALKTTGDAALDKRISSDLSRLASWFQVHPRLYYFDDERPNAFSSNRIYGEPDDFPPERNQFGSILFGKKLLRTEMGATPEGQPNFTVTAIIAHELGHTLQFLRKSTLPVVQKELQADFLAGWTIRYIERNGGPDVDEHDVFSTFYKKGDLEFNNPEHHGTKKERQSAFLAGYGVEDDDVKIAYAKGDEYIRNIPLQVAMEFYAKNLGIYYVVIPSPDGTFGLKISRPPAADSPVGRGLLEVGDVILTLDELPIRSPQDIIAHTARTTVFLIDGKTGLPQEAVIELP